MPFEFNDHHQLVGQHAFLGASNHHWTNYSDDKLRSTFYSSQAKERGTRLHALAAEHIDLRIKLPRNNQTLNAYVNDAIGFQMTPEVVLYYSPYCFGTTDAICVKNHFIRIHDYKSGETPASMTQLMIYAALFCLEYFKDPKDYEFELRIYQSDKIDICNPTPDEVRTMMDKIIHADKILSSLEEG